MKINRISFILTFIFITIININITNGQAYPVNMHHLSGDRDKLINIVLLSEGYTLSEMPQFRQDVENTIDFLLDCTPFFEYHKHFNIFSIEVPSNESGTDHPGTADDCDNRPVFQSDTYFNSTFDAAGIHRLLVVENKSGIYSVLQNNLPDWDAVFIIVNHTWYGGSGGTFATFSMHSSSSKVAIHELGHSFAKLADEYETGGMTPREAPNTTSENRRSFIRWRPWIKESTPIPTPEENGFSEVIGLFEGAVYHPVGWYRPKLNCKMRNSNVDFCQVCQEQIIKKIYESSSSIHTIYPDTSSIIVKNIQNIYLSVELYNPEQIQYSFQWYIDGQKQEGALSSSILFSSQLLGEGIHDVRAKVLYYSDLVKNDPDHYLSDSVDWVINISGVDKQIYLFNNYPNPFNLSTNLNFGLPEKSHVSLKIYNILGQEIETLVDSQKQPGVHTINWNPQHASGIYIYRFEANSNMNKDNFIKTGKLMLIR